MSSERPTRGSEAFFGRRKGKTLRPAQADALSDLLPRLRLDPETASPDDLSELYTRAFGTYRLEIGFGGGEHLLHRAHAMPQTGFIGVEPFVNGLAKCVAALAAEPLDNVRLYDDDATRLLDWLPEASLDQVDLLYPDPWPKKKHWKRRFVSPVNLDRIARVLKPGGLFCFASDIDSYVNWTLLHTRNHKQFSWLATCADDWRLAYEGWPGTRYEAKALREGRVAAYLTFKRR
ncbi:tRNA (guanine(46)-N(7))-methyltransferase TrmB [Hoeflea prorocentri]|uniref:tRNA (guanine-N(7)-)-methyltransferase n=1 Tax=Hoeflea prorocentri TaxID=1922333 RepID=A0A9X3ZJG6_9HYPH|nr:tRNA (guanosine(46)-N(7))-methyltransferase TrmB [Hoeflea prorocentri]MCY6382755.1 tRNA (guanosine(46)-N(7))-methyltransferase TrmB [Hoeflea prorocentri]MDA5400555.1 tRNA (guanosine(46)-N(7))-methyltransferase TrmB [Hoeflea prorocentri]